MALSDLEMTFMGLACQPNQFGVALGQALVTAPTNPNRGERRVTARARRL